MERNIITILACGFFLAEAAKLPGHLQADTGEHLSGFSSILRPHTFKKVPEHISIRLLTSALKNVLSSQNDFVASLSSSSDISDDFQHSSEDQFKDLINKESFSELQVPMHNGDFFGEPEPRGAAPLVTSKTLISTENVLSIGQESLSRNQGIFLSSLKPLQPFDQSISESLGTPSSDQQFIVSQIETSDHDHLNPESSATSSNSNQVIESPSESSLSSSTTSSHSQQPTVSHLDSSQQHDHPNFESIGSSSPEPLSRDQGFLLSNLKPLQPFDQSNRKSLDTPSFDQQFIVSQIETSDQNHPNPESSVISSDANQFIEPPLESSLSSFTTSSHSQQPAVSHLESSQLQDHPNFESIGISFPEQDFSNSHLEFPLVVSSHNQEIPSSHKALSQPNDQTPSESFFTSSHDQQFAITHLESPQEDGDTNAQLFSVPSLDQEIPSSHIILPELQHHTDSESFSTASNDQDFGISHLESSQETGNTDAHLFEVPFHNQEIRTSHIISSQLQNQTDSESFFISPQEGNQDSESSASFSLDQKFVAPLLEFGHRNSEPFSVSLPDNQVLFHPSEFLEPLTNHKQDVITASFNEQQFVVLNPESSDQLDHSFDFGSSGSLNLHSGLEENLPQSKSFISSIISESKSFNGPEHSSFDGQLGSYGQETRNFDEKFKHTSIDENFGQVSFSSSNPSSFNSDIFANGGYGTSPTEFTADISSNQDFLSQPFKGFNDFDQINQGCPHNQIRHVDGKCVTPEISRRIYVIDAPKPTAGVVSKLEIPPPTVEENTIFIRSAIPNESLDPIIVPPPQRRDTIYILGGKSQDQDRGLIEVAPSPHHRPEVYFLNYNDGQIPALPDGLDLERALSSAIPIEGRVITANEGRGGPDFTSNGDISFTGESVTHDGASEISVTGFDVRSHGITDFINRPTDFVTSVSSSFNPGGNIGHSTSGNSNFGGISPTGHDGANRYHGGTQ